MPTLANATATATGQTTATASVDTDTASGTLYAVVQAASIGDPTATQIKNGNAGDGTAAADSDSQAISSTGTKSFGFSGLSAATDYQVFFVHEDSSGTDSSVVSSGTITTDEEVVDLSNATASSTGQNTGQASVDTDTGAGTLYLVVQEDGVSAPSKTQMRNGNAGDGTPAAASDSQAVSSTGTKSFTFSGLTSGTTYRAYFYQET